MNQKKLVGEYAAHFVKDKMIVGLGTGSTAKYLVEALAQRIKDEKLEITCVATSEVTSQQAKSLQMNVVDLASVDQIDLTIDGADEISPEFHGIKGGGGALLYEKVVAMNSKENIWIVDESKLVDTLGAFPLPVEIIQFGHEKTFAQFYEMGYQPSYRLDQHGEKFITDAGNFIIDLHLENIDNPEAFADKLIKTVGVVEHGLFIDIVDRVVVGNEAGEVNVLEA